MALSESSIGPLPFMKQQAEISSPSPLDQVRKLNALSSERVAIVGPAAASLALGEAAVAYPGTTEASVSKGHYQHLQTQEEWQEDPERGEGWLRKGGLAVSVGPGYRTGHENLMERTWLLETPDGPLAIAGLPDVYARNQHESQLEDTGLAQSIRNRLHDPEQPPLSKIVLARTIKDVELLLAQNANLEHLPDFERSIWLAADAMYGAGVTLGDEEVGRANRVYGTLERGRPHAYYHNAMSLLQDGRRALKHGKRAGLSPEHQLAGFVGSLSADRYYGNGREKDNPGNPMNSDENVSALITYKRALMLEFHKSTARLFKTQIRYSAFIEAIKEQRGRHHPHPAVRTVCGADLQGTSESEGPLDALALFFEDYMSRRFADDDTIIVDIYEWHVKTRGFEDIGTPEDIIRFFDVHQLLDVQLKPGQLTPRQAGVKHHRGNAGFVGFGALHSHVFPDGWTLEDRNMRRENAKILNEAADCLEQGGTFGDVQELILSRSITSR